MSWGWGEERTFEVARHLVGWLRPLELHGSVAGVLLPGRRPDGSGPANGFGGSVQELNERLARSETSVGDLEEGHAETHAIQAGQEGALDDAGGLDAVILAELAVDLVGDTRQLERAQSAQVVDEKDELILGLVGDEGAVRVVVVENLEQHGLDQLGERGLDAVGTRLIVDAHADLNLAVRD